MNATKLLVLTAALLAPLMLAGCNTIAGAGTDITSGARTVQQHL
jgi:predicted small secreted protein